MNNPEDPNSYDEEFQKKIEAILKMGGISKDELKEAFAEEEQQACQQCSVSEIHKNHVIDCTNAHNNTAQLWKFIDEVCSGNNSARMRCSAYCMNLLEGFQDLVDDEKHCGSPVLRSVLAAYVTQLMAQHAAEVIGKINSGEDHKSIKALNTLMEIARPRTEDEINKLKGQ